MSSSEPLHQDIIDAFTLKIKVYNLTCHRHSVYVRRDIFNDFYKIELSELKTNQEILYELKTFPFIGYATIVIIMNYRCLCRFSEIDGNETLRKVLDAFKYNELHVRYITKLLYLPYHTIRNESNFAKNIHKVYFKHYFNDLQKSKNYQKSSFIKPNLEEYIQDKSSVDDKNSDNSLIEQAIKDYQLYLDVLQIDNLILMQYTTVGRYKVIDELSATFGRLMENNCVSLKEFFNLIIRNDGLTIKENLGIVLTFTNADLYFYSINAALAIIINNKHFTSKKLKMREGSEKDVEKLCRAFQISKVAHCVLHNLTRDQILAVIEALRKLNFNLFKNVFICIMSHGEENGVIHTNDGELKVGHITQLYKAIATSYDDVYTFLILAACRGGTEPDWADEDDIKDTPPLDMPRNMTVYFSTREGLISYRDAIEGKPFITFLTERYLSALHNEKFRNVGDSIYNSMNQEFGPEYLGQNEDTSLCKQPVSLNKDFMENVAKFKKKLSANLQCKVKEIFPIGILVENESDKKSSEGDFSADQIRTEILQLKGTTNILSAKFQCLDFLKKFAPFESWQYLTDFENNLKLNSNCASELKDFFKDNQDINIYIENALSSLITDYLALQCQWGDDSGYKDIQNLNRLDTLNFINILWEVVKGKFLIDNQEEFNIICENWIKETKSRILKLAVLKKLQYTPFENEYDLAEVEEVLQKSDENFKYIKEYILNILQSNSYNEQIDNFSLSDHLYYKKIYNTPQCPYNLFKEVTEVLPQSKTEQVSFFRDLKFYDINEFLLFNQSLHINKSFQTWLEYYLNLGIIPSREPNIFLQRIWLRLFSESILHKFSWLPDESGHKTSIKFLKITNIILCIFCKHFENSDNLELFDKICNKYFGVSSELKGNNRLIKELPLETLQDVLEYNEVLKNSSTAVERLQHFLNIYWNEQETIDNNLNKVLSKIFNKNKIIKNLRNSIIKDEFFTTFKKLFLTKIIYNYVTDLRDHNETNVNAELKNWFDLGDSKNEKLSKCTLEYFMENIPFVNFEIFTKCEKLFENSSNSNRLKFFLKELFAERKQSENCVIEMCQEIFDTQLLHSKNFEYLNSNIIMVLKMACKECLVSDDKKEWNHFQQYSEYIDFWFDKNRINISSILDNTPLETEEQLLEFDSLVRKSNNCHQFIEKFLRKFLYFQTEYSALSFLLTEELSFEAILKFEIFELYQIIFKIYKHTDINIINDKKLRLLYYFLWSTPYIYYRDEKLLLKEQRIQIGIDNFKKISSEMCEEFVVPIKSFKSHNFDIFKENEVLNSDNLNILVQTIADDEAKVSLLEYELYFNCKTQNLASIDTDNARYYFDKDRLALEEILIKNLPLNTANLKQLECHLNRSTHAQTHLKDFIENHIEISFNILLKLYVQVKIKIFSMWLRLLREELIQDMDWQEDVQNLILTQIVKQVRTLYTEDINTNCVIYSKKFFEERNLRKAFRFLESLPFKTLEQAKEAENDIGNNCELKKYLKEFLDEIPLHKVDSINILGEIFDPIIEECTWYTDDETQKYCLYTSTFIKIWTTTFQGRGKTPQFYEYMNLLRDRLFPKLPREMNSKADCCELGKIIQRLPLNEILLHQLETCIQGSAEALSYWTNYLTKRMVFSSDILKYYDKNKIMICNFLYQLFDEKFLEICDWKNEFEILHLKSLSYLDNSIWTEQEFKKIVLQSLYEETSKNIAQFVNTVPFKSLQDLWKFENRIKESQKYRDSVQNAIKNSIHFKIESGLSPNKIYDMFSDIFAPIIDKCVWNCLDSGETNLCCISKLNFTNIVYQTINNEIKPSNWKFLAELQENLFKPFPLPTNYKEIRTVPKWKFLYELRRHLFKHTPSKLDEFDEEFMDLENIIKILPLDNLTVLESYLQRSSYSMECWIELLKNKLKSLHHDNDNDYKMQIFKLWTIVVSDDLFKEYNCYEEFKKSIAWISLYRTLPGDQEFFDLYTEYCFLFSKELNFAKYKFIKYLPISNLEQLNYLEQNLTRSCYRNVVKNYIHNIFQYHCKTMNKENVEIEYILYKQFEPILQHCNGFDNNLLNIGNWDLTKLKFTKLLQEVYVKVYKEPDWEFGYKLSKMILTYKPQSVKWCQMKSPELQEIIKQLPLSNKRLIYQLEECINSSENALNYWLFYISRNSQENASNFWQHYTPTQNFDYNAAEKDVYAFWYLLLPEIVIEQCIWENEIKSLTITKTFRFTYGNAEKFNKYSKRWFSENTWRHVFKFFNFAPVKSCKNLIEFDKLISKYQSLEVKKCFQEIFRQETQNEPNEILNKIACLLNNIQNEFVWRREDSANVKEYCSELLKDHSETSNVTNISGEYHYTKHFIYYILEKSDEQSESDKHSESDEKLESDKKYSKNEFCSLTLVKLLQQTFSELYEIPKCKFLYIIRRKIFPKTPTNINKYELDKGTIQNFSILLPLKSLNKFDEFCLYLKESVYNYAFFYTFLKWIFSSDETTTNDEYKNFIYRVWHSFLVKDLIRHNGWTNEVENAEICLILFKVGGLENRKFYTYSRILIEFYPETNISMPITSLIQLKEMDKLLNDFPSYRANIEKYFLAIFELNLKKQNFMLKLLSELFKPILSECIWNDSEDPLNCEKYQLSKSPLLNCIQEKFEQIYNLSKLDFMYLMHKMLFKETIINFNQFPLKTKEELLQLENIVNTSEHASRYLLEWLQQLTKNPFSNYFYVNSSLWLFLLDENIIEHLNWVKDIEPLTITNILTSAFKQSDGIFIDSQQLFCDPLYRKVVCSLKNLPFKSLEHLQSFEKDILENSSYKECMKKYFYKEVLWWLGISKTFPLIFAAIKDDCAWDYKDQVDPDNRLPCIRLLTITNILQQLYHERLCFMPKWEFLYSIRLGLFDRSPFCTEESKNHLKQMLDQFPFYIKHDLQQFDSLIRKSEDALDLWFRYTLALKTFDISEVESDSKIRIGQFCDKSEIENDFAIYVFNIWHHLFHETLAEKCTWEEDISEIAMTTTLTYRYENHIAFRKISEIWFNNNDFRRSIDYGKLPSKTFQKV